MKWTVKKVERALGGKLIGNPVMRRFICETILLLPSEIIEYVCARVWFISSPEDSWALTFKGSEIKDRSLILISDELLNQNERQIKHTVLHEIGHVLLNHRNSIGYQQTPIEISRQEREADLFADKYLPL